MRRTAFYLFQLILLFVLLASFSTGQVQVPTGTPPFGSFGGGPFDIVNLGNLNAHFYIPIIQKAGRGAPYVFDLSYDTSVWYQARVSGTQTWQPVANNGWTFAVPQYALGYVSSQTITSWTQPCNPPGNMNPVFVAIYGFFVYHDVKGGTHPFSSGLEVSYQSLSGCAVTAPPATATGVATDGSGYSLNVNSTVNGANAAVTGPDGKLLNTTTTSSTTTDANGNKVTATTGVGANLQITDTLGQNALTVTGTNPVSLTYTAPNGNPASYTLNYTTKNVQTNFGCSGVAEYSASNVPLLTSIGLPDGTSYTFTYEDTPGFSGYKTARLTQVSLPTGGSISYTYNGANDGAVCADGSTLGLSRALSPGGTWTYARTNVSGTQWQTTVTSPPDPVNSGSAPDVTVINFSQDGNTGSPTYNFYETQRMVYQGSTSGTLLLKTVNCWNANFTSCATQTVSSPITQLDHSRYPTGVTYPAVSETLYNSYGLLTEDKETDFVSTTGGSPYLSDTLITYASLGNGIVNQVSNVKVNGPGATTVANTTYTYDQGTPTATSGTPQHVSITGSRGNLTTAATQTSSGGATLYKRITYYDTGTVNTASDYGTTSSGGANLTTYNYANATSTCGNAFPTSVSEPLSLSRSFTWNCVGGVMTSQTDENGKITTTDFATDPDFWRADYIQDPLLYKTTFSYTGQTAAENNLSFNSGNSVLDVRTTVDGFGRTTLSQRAQTPSLANYDSSETDYNIMGQASRSTMPFQAAAGVTNPTAPGITTVYDALGRPTLVTDGGGGTVSYTYIGNDMLQVTGPTQTFQKQLEYDGLGRLTSVCEITSATGSGTCGQTNSKTGYWTQYTYDAVGNLLTVTQNAQPSSIGSQTRTYTYDMMSRLLSEVNPETGNGGTSGTVSYSYDAACGSYLASAGDLTKRYDNAHNTTCYGYDALHRLKDAGNTGPTCRHYRYDTQTPPSGVTVSNTLARQAEAYTDNCTSGKITDEWFGYDADGNLTDFYESTPHSGGYYRSSATYWANGAVEGLSALTSTSTAIFPTIYYGTSTGAGLDGEGRYTKVNAASGTNPVTGVTYVTSGTSEPIGALTGVTYGSADSDSFTFYPNTGLPHISTFTVNGTNDKETLTWNTNETLGKLVIADSLSGTTDSQTCNYYYDDLGRLGGQNGSGYSVDCGSTKWQQQFTFDPFGNIKKPLGNAIFTPTYSTANTNQFYSIPGVTVSYDANGNLLTDNLNSYTWDPNWGNPASVNSTNLIYDALGKMVEQQNGSTYTQMLYSQLGKTAIMNGQTLAKAFVNLPGGGTAIYNTTGLAYYRHADWLGSSRLTSTSSRTVVSDLAYAPFGEQYAITGTADPSFTGQNADTVSSLYDFTFREDSPSQGRWISPDPAGLAAVDLTNPQTWNRYAYVMNSPLALVDPLGTCWQLHYNTTETHWPDGTTTTDYNIGSIDDNGPCNDVCAGQGYLIIQGYLICGPPANLAAFTSQIESQLNSMSGLSAKEVKQAIAKRGIHECYNGFINNTKVGKAVGVLSVGPVLTPLNDESDFQQLMMLGEVEVMPALKAIGNHLIPEIAEKIESGFGFGTLVSTGVDMAVAQGCSMSQVFVPTGTDYPDPGTPGGNPSDPSDPGNW